MRYRFPGHRPGERFGTKFGIIATSEEDGGAELSDKMAAFFESRGTKIEPISEKPLPSAPIHPPRRRSARTQQTLDDIADAAAKANAAFNRVPDPGKG